MKIHSILILYTIIKKMREIILRKTDRPMDKDKDIKSYH